MSLFGRKLLSTATVAPIVAKPLPPKAHHHAPIDSSFFPKSFVVGAVHAGVKKKAGVEDLTVIASTSSRPTTAAACFTRNAFKAAPVLVSDQILRQNGGYASAVVINSGCANAVTGKQGLKDALEMVNETDGVLQSEREAGKRYKNQSLVMSTGVIGQNLPIQKVVDGIRKLGLKGALGATFNHWERAAKGMMTTDTFPKLRAKSFNIGGITYRMAGFDKGAGMIHPDMGPASTLFASTPKELHATLLGCIVTDAAVSPKSLQSALTYAVDRSFNSISVDGDMSTNDSIYVLANGAAAPDSEVIDEETNRESYEVFKTELTNFAQDLAKLVVRDGEGATKFVTVTVHGAPSYRDAHNIASRISTSALVKTALYGEDANWGRILAAAGSVPLSPSQTNTQNTAAPTIDPTKVSVTFVPADGTASLPVLVNGEPVEVDEVRAKEILSEEEFEIVVDLGNGTGENTTARYWTCDFSYEYVRINGDYRS